MIISGSGVTAEHCGIHLNRRGADAGNIPKGKTAYGTQDLLWAEELRPIFHVGGGGGVRCRISFRHLGEISRIACTRQGGEG